MIRKYVGIRAGYNSYSISLLVSNGLEELTAMKIVINKV